MLNESEKAVVPVPPVGADGEQPQDKTPNLSITDSEEECKGENALEQSLKKLRQMAMEPSSLHTLTLSELYENVYLKKDPERRNWRKRNFLHGGNHPIRYWRQFPRL